MNDDLEIVDYYSRSQAIADGVLVEASTLAKEAGFKFPIALTQAAWCTCVEVTDGMVGQDETGRLWDVLTMLRHAIALKPKAEGVLLFSVLVCNSKNRLRKIQLKCCMGADMDGSRYLTIMLPEED